MAKHTKPNAPKKAFPGAAKPFKKDNDAGKKDNGKKNNGKKK